MRHGVYYGPRAVPCACGSTEAYWHGPEDGAREYACDACWELRQKPQTAHGSAFPHEGGCEGCRDEDRCNYCGRTPPKFRATRCTNGRCFDCHREHCTPGGSTSPGHGYGV
jgi:hypothetical protein